MKKTAACLAAIMTLLSLTACTDTAKNNNLLTENNLSAAVDQETDNTNKVTEQNITDTTTNKVETEFTSVLNKESETANTPGDLNVEPASSPALTLNSSDYVLNANFTPIFDDVQFMDVPATGKVCSYEELQDFMNSYEDISFVEYEIISQYSPEEAFAKTGDEIFKYSTTLYQAHIYYDYLHDTPVDIIVDLAKAGMPDQQIENNPPYAIGQKIISALSGFNSTSCVAIPELVYYVYDVSGIDLAYHVGNENVSVKSAAFVNLDMNLIENERSVVTTTTNNPVKFTQKSTVDDLAQFIKQDWQARGYKFFDVPNFDYNAQPKHSNNEDDIKETKETTATEIISRKYTPSADEQKKIQELLLESKEFFYGYVDCKEIVKHKSSNNFITTTEIYDNGMLEGESYEKKWYEIVDGDIMSLKDLNKKMENILTDTMIDNFQTIINYTYFEENGKLYISEYSGESGSLMGIDTTHITSIGEVDETTIVLYMNAFGKGENWDVDFDTSEDFTVILKRTESGFKIDECSNRARMFITWQYTTEGDIF